MAYNKKGYYIRAKMIQEFTAQHFEPGRQDRCYAAIWRRYIYPRLGICYMTYLRYLKARAPGEASSQSKQLTLFDLNGKD